MYVLAVSMRIREPLPLPEKKVEFAPGMHVELKCFLIKKPLCKILIGSALKHIKNELNQYSKIVHINTDEHTCRVEIHWS